MCQISRETNEIVQLKERLFSELGFCMHMQESI